MVEQGSIADVLAIMLGQKSEVPHWARPQGLLRYLNRRLQQFNPRRRARHNVAHHYDLDGRLYSLFLDADRQYSCAYFESPEQSLDDAQLAKKRHLAAKLLLRDDRDLRVLDIGCGWGGLGFYLAEVAGADVTGVTLSQEQHAIANERAAEKGLAERARFKLQDYRDVAGPFDRIVSVGMFEHVGVNHYDTFFRKSAQLLADDGVMVLHSIGRSEGPERDQSVDRQIHFPRRLYPVAVRGAAAHREVRAAGHRHRDPAPALRRDAQGTGASASSPTARRSSASTTGVSCGCGSSIWPRPKCRSASRT